MCVVAVRLTPSHLPEWHSFPPRIWLSRSWFLQSDNLSAVDHFWTQANYRLWKSSASVESPASCTPLQLRAVHQWGMVVCDENDRCRLESNNRWAHSRAPTSHRNKANYATDTHTGNRRQRERERERTTMSEIEWFVADDEWSPCAFVCSFIVVKITCENLICFFNDCCRID